MLDMYNSVSQEVITNGNLTFDTNKVAMGITTIHTEGSAHVELDYPGVYLVLFDGIASLTTDPGEGDTPDPITIQLYNGNNLVYDGVASETSTSTTDVVNLNFSTLIPVKRSCCMVDNDANLVFTNIGAPATFSKASVKIIKVY